MMVGLSGCENSASFKSSRTTDSDSSVDTSSSIIVGDWDIVSGENSYDLVESYSFKTVTINLDTLTVTSKSSVLVVGTTDSSVTPVTPDSTTVITVSEETYGVTIESSAPEDTLVEYALYGGFSQSVTIYSDYDFKLSLRGVTIASSDGPAINIQSKQRAFVELASSSINTLSDTTTWSDDRYLYDGEEMNLKGTLFSEGPLIFSGSVSLGITANKKHALASDAHVRVVTMTAYNKDGIHTNDAIDANGTITITGGVIVANGTGGAEGGFDDDENTFTITGGLFVGIGGRNSTPTRSVTTQNTVALRNVGSGLMAFKASAGNVAFAYTMPGSSDAALLGSPDLETGTTYTIYQGGTIGSYGDKFNGLYISPAAHSGGASGSSFIISSSVTSL